MRQSALGERPEGLWNGYRTFSWKDKISAEKIRKIFNQNIFSRVRYRASD